MARVFTRSKALRKHAVSDPKLQLWKTRLPCNPWNRAAVSRATHRAEHNTGCNIEPTCDDGKLAAIAVCPGHTHFDDPKDTFYRSLDKSRSRGQVTMSGKKRRR